LRGLLQLVDAPRELRLARAGRPEQQDRRVEAAATRSTCSMVRLKAALRVAMPDLSSSEALRVLALEARGDAS
jgi:hypothetical protein